MLFTTLAWTRGIIAPKRLLAQEAILEAPKASDRRLVAGTGSSPVTRHSSLVTALGPAAGRALHNPTHRDSPYVCAPAYHASAPTGRKTADTLGLPTWGSRFFLKTADLND